MFPRWTAADFTARSQAIAVRSNGSFCCEQSFSHGGTNDQVWIGSGRWLRSASPWDRPRARRPATDTCDKARVWTSAILRQGRHPNSAMPRDDLASIRNEHRVGGPEPLDASSDLLDPRLAVDAGVARIGSQRRYRWETKALVGARKVRHSSNCSRHAGETRILPELVPHEKMTNASY